MYNEEKIINGVLMFRSTPDGEWRQCSIEKMGERIIQLQKDVEGLHEQLGKSLREAEERAYVQGKQYEKDRLSELLGLSG